MAAAREAAWQGSARAKAAKQQGARAAAVKAFADARCAAEVAEGAAPFVPGTWAMAAAILDEALDLGGGTGAIDVALAQARLDTARTGAP